MMHTYYFIHGRQPHIGRAELEAIFGAPAIQPFTQHASRLTQNKPLNPNALIQRLGGSMRICMPIGSFDYTQPRCTLARLENILFNNITETAALDGKIMLGISSYGTAISTKQLHGLGLSIKKQLKKHRSGSVRIIPNKQPILNSAQVLRNKLTKKSGYEFVLIRNGSTIFVCKTLAIQDIDAYAARDQARPWRDAKVGMLPPKLAQIIINLAIGRLGFEDKNNLGLDIAQTADAVQTVVLDPFCGTGVLIQEARLMGYVGHGADIDPRIGEFYLKNMEWLSKQYPDIPNSSWQLADATNATWEKSEFYDDNSVVRRIPLSFDTIAAETYLGRPLSAPPLDEVLQKIIQDVDTIHKKFLLNVARQTRPGFRLCLAVPAWFLKGRIKHLPILDHLTDIGYTRLSFKYAKDKDLIYRRENQIVGRELLVLIRK
jgi:hypothetical protein